MKIAGPWTRLEQEKKMKNATCPPSGAAPLVPGNHRAQHCRAFSQRGVSPTYKCEIACGASQTPARTNEHSRGIRAPFTVHSVPGVARGAAARASGWSESAPSPYSSGPWWPSTTPALQERSWKESTIPPGSRVQSKLGPRSVALTGPSRASI